MAERAKQSGDWVPPIESGSATQKKQEGKSPSVTPKGSVKPKSSQRSGSGGRKAKKSSRSEQRAALQAAKKKGREKVAKQDGEITVKMAGMILDQTPAELPKGTGLVYDESIQRHRCPIGSKHGESECPERLTVCMERLEARGLVERCIRVPTRPITDEEILSLHSEEYLQTLKTISSLPADELQKLAESYDSVFLCNESFEVVRLVAGGLLNLTEKVVKGELRNGCAVVRLSGHHAQRDRANGYSILNSVSLAAKQARTKWGIDRVLIVDWDVHHGQGTQYFFEDDPSVVYFSMHRYENMDFWPHLEESNYDHIGQGAGKGYNVNVPWNKTGMGDAEFLAVFHNLLLPLAHEFNPQLILVSAGFDCAINDPKGEMAVSPACFAHLTRELMSLAEGRVVLSQEGGYCLDSLGESMAWCVEALLGDECPALPPLKGVCDSASETMLNVIKALQPYWNCFQCQVKPLESKKPIQNEAVSSTTPDDQPSQGGEGNGAADPAAEVRAVGDRLQKELALSRPPHRTGLVYDEQMKLHKAFNHPERPERISRIYAKHQEHGLVTRCHRLKSRKVTDEELRTCHLDILIDNVKMTSKHTARELIDIQHKHNVSKYSRDVYLHPDTYLCASIAAGCVLNLVDAVLTNQVLNAVGIVRPPGHHADSAVIAGFCFFNNVAIASRYAQNKYGIKRVLIVDWDVHHGNGTQRIFEEDPSVLYISLHRHERGAFYPPGPEGAADRVGKGRGRGYNVNIGWNTGQQGGMGDAEYLTAFHHVIMPLAYEFQPELVFISAGFDAAKGDPLGGCMVSPEGYGHMTHMLCSLANGRVITVLEGGYNLHSISVSMAMCTRVMLGDSCPDITPGIPAQCGMQAIYDAAKAHENFWTSMKNEVDILETMIYSEEVKEESGSEKETGAETKPIKEGSPGGVAEVTSTEGIDGDGGASGVGKGDDDGADGGVADIAEGLSKMSVTGTAAGGGERDKEGVLQEQDDKNDDEALGACGLSDPGPMEAGRGDGKGNILSSLAETFGSEVQMHAVIPLTWCPHLSTDVEPMPFTGLDAREPCGECGDDKENWVCLSCYKVYCGRYVNEHMLMHGLATDHHMVLSYADLSVWCYGCESYVHHEVLIPAKRAAHISKFGEDIPGMEN